MAQISINVSTQHGSSVIVGKMASDDCLAFETTVWLRGPLTTEPHCYCRDTVSIHGDPLAIRQLLEKLLTTLNARRKQDWEAANADTLRRAEA